MFRGHFEHAVDDKGRVAVPIPFREELTRLQDDRLVATKYLIDGNRCLDVYPLSAWRRLDSSRLAKSRVDPRYVRFRNVYVSGAHELAIDSQGRVLLPPLLREKAGIASAGMGTGGVDKVPNWAREGWRNRGAEYERPFRRRADISPDPGRAPSCRRLRNRPRATRSRSCRFSLVKGLESRRHRRRGP